MMTTLWRWSTEGAEFWVRSGGIWPAEGAGEVPGCCLAKYAVWLLLSGAELALTTILVTFSGVDEREGVRETDFRRSGLAVGADLGAMAAIQGKGG